MTETTIVLGASSNPDRFSYKAVKSLSLHHQPVIAIGNKAGKIGNVEIIVGKPKLENVHTITLYLNQLHQKEYYDYIISLKPKRLIFNPGTENPEFELLADQSGIEVIKSCTLIMLSTEKF
jgi:predicted CoA-binding protein